MWAKAVYVALVSMCSSVHEVLNSVPRTMKEREKRESRRMEFH